MDDRDAAPCKRTPSPDPPPPPSTAILHVRAGWPAVQPLAFGIAVPLSHTLSSRCGQPSVPGIGDVRRVVVIGAGPSGLVATKTLIEQGYDAVCVEVLLT